MKTMQRKKLIAALGLALGSVIPLPAGAQTAPAIPPSINTPDKVESSIGTLQYKDGAPSKETVAKAYDYLDLMHGVEAFMNAYQGASVASIFKGIEDAGIPNNTALIFSELMDAKSLFLTTNADTVYFFVNLDVTKGPIVVETPPLSSSRDCTVPGSPCPLATQQTAVLGIINANTNLLIEKIPQSSGSHSVAADSRLNRIFVPQVAPASVVGSGGDTTATGAGICGTNSGCVAVYKHNGKDQDGDDDDHDHDHEADAH